MNFRLTYCVLTTFMLAAKGTMSMETSSNSNSNNHELTTPHDEGFVDMASIARDDGIIDIVPMDQDGDFMDNHSRSLFKSKNRNCKFSASITCHVRDEEKTDCKDLNIRTDRCGELPILMNYTYCNNEINEANRIIILPSLAYAKLYETERVKLNTDPLRAGKCRSILQRTKTDTCKRNRVNADMKIEGWKKFRRNYGSYCHVYKHYFPKINKFDPPIAPEYEVIANCFLENGKGTKDYSIPCETLNPDYFNNRRRLRSLQEFELVEVEVESDIDFSRNIFYEFIISSNAEETVKVNEISILLDNERTTLKDDSDNIVVGAGETKVVATYSKLVDFSTYSGDAFELGSVIRVTGVNSGESTVETNAETIQVP
jgi:hypothetical protein